MTEEKLKSRCVLSGGREETGGGGGEEGEGEGKEKEEDGGEVGGLAE